MTEGVKTLMGSPKRAILKLSIPMIIAMSAHTLYNLVDAIWVSGLGPKAIAAVGYVFPFFFFAMALSSGIGVGGGSAVSRKIGAQDKAGADQVATHTIVIMLITSGLIAGGMFFITKPILATLGAGDTLPLAYDYAKIIFSGIVLLFFNQISISLLRSEGDAKRSMYLMLTGVILNTILDPIFIYTFGLGVSGAAYATVLSMSFVSIISFYWLFFQKNTYVSFKFRSFKFNRSVIWDISRVGLPSIVSQASMSLMSLALITIITKVGGSEGVAIYTTGWRIIGLAIMPILGIATAVTSVSGAAYGSRNYENIKKAYFYAIKIGVVAEVILSILIFIFAKQFSWIFTWSELTKTIRPGLINFLRIICLMMITAPVGMASAAMFEGTGKGLYSLMMTILRTLIFTVPFAWLGGIYFNGGLTGVWWGMSVAGLTYLPIAFGWSTNYLHNLMKTNVSLTK